MDPKFAFIPSAYKSEKVYSLLPNTSDGDFDDFDRASIAYRVNEEGIMETVSANIPRIDHLHNCPSLLLEDTSTNSFTYSEEFDNAVWSKQSATIQANEAIAPNGFLAADRITVNENNSSGYIYRTPTISTNQWYSFSIFVKNHNDEQGLVDVEFWNSDSGTWAKSRFSFLTEQVETSGEYLDFGNVEKYGNGWYRIGIVFKAPSSWTGTNYFRVFAYGGYGKSMFIWGAQQEQRRNVTSYILSSGTAQTRSDESCFGNIFDDYNKAEGTIFLDCEPHAFTSIYNAYYMLSIGYGAGLNEWFAISSKVDANDDTFLAVQAFVPYSTWLNYSNLIEVRQRFRIAITYIRGYQYRVFINGELVNTTSHYNGYSYPAFNSPNLQIRFANPTANSVPRTNGRIFDVRYYDKVLTENELIELTTL